MNTAFEITTSAVPFASDAVGAVYVSVWSSARSNASVSVSPEPDCVATSPGWASPDTDQPVGKLDTAPARKSAAKADEEAERKHARTDATTAKRPHPRWRDSVFMFDFPDRDSQSAPGKGTDGADYTPSRTRASSIFRAHSRVRRIREISASEEQIEEESEEMRQGRRRARAGVGRPRIRRAEAAGRRGRGSRRRRGRIRRRLKG